MIRSSSTITSSGSDSVFVSAGSSSKSTRPSSFSVVWLTRETSFGVSAGVSSISSSSSVNSGISMSCVTGSTLVCFIFCFASSSFARSVASRTLRRLLKFAVSSGIRSSLFVSLLSNSMESSMSASSSWNVSPLSFSARSRSISFCRAAQSLPSFKSSSSNFIFFAPHSSVSALYLLLFFFPCFNSQSVFSRSLTCRK